MSEESSKIAIAFIRMSDIEEITTLKDKTIYRHIGEGVFPPSITLGEQSSGWLKHEVEAILKARILGVKCKDKLRNIVKGLIKKRDTLHI